MTENEAKDILRAIGLWRAQEGEVAECEAIDMAMNAIEEIQSYRAIGTVEEFEALKEKEEECDNGWIPCSKKPPEAGIHQEVWITLEDVEGTYKASWYLDHFEWENGVVIKEMPLAWMPYIIPDPYTPT